MAQETNLKQYNHLTLTGGPVTIWYGDTREDGTAEVKAIRLFSKKFTLYPSAGTMVIGPETVGSREIKDGDVQMQDLSIDLQRKLDYDVATADDVRQMVTDAIADGDDAQQK